MHVFLSTRRYAWACWSHHKKRRRRKKRCKWMRTRDQVSLRTGVMLVHCVPQLNCACALLAAAKLDVLLKPHAGDFLRLWWCPSFVFLQTQFFFSCVHYFILTNSTVAAFSKWGWGQHLHVCLNRCPSVCIRCRHYCRLLFVNFFSVLIFAVRKRY